MAYEKSDALLCCSLVSAMYAMVGTWKSACKPSGGKFKGTPLAMDPVTKIAGTISGRVSSCLFAASNFGMKEFTNASHAFDNLEVLNIQNKNDIVPHVPPQAVGFRAVGSILEFDQNYGAVVENHPLSTTLMPFCMSW